MKNFTDLQATIKQHTPSVPEIAEEAIIEAEEWVLGFDFKVDNSSTEGRAIQNDLKTKFKKIYSGSGSGGEGFDVSFQGPKKEIDKAKKYVESKYKKNINPKFTNLYLDEGFEVTEIESESVELDEKVMGASYPSGHPSRKFSVPASKEITKHIESGKAKILKKSVSVLGTTTRFVVITNPEYRNAKVSGQDKVLMATISDPKRGSIKMFQFYGSHVSVAKAMQFAINNKLVVTTTFESVELDEAWTADSVTKNAEIGSKKGYGINIKKTGGVTKTPYKHMLMTTRSHGNVRVTFDHGKEEFEGTPQSVALHINKLLGIKESVDNPEYDEELGKKNIGEGKAWDAITKVKDKNQNQKVHGMIVDAMTANLLHKVHDALNSTNQKKFVATIDKNAAGLKKMVDFAYKQVK